MDFRDSKSGVVLWESSLWMGALDDGSFHCGDFEERAPLEGEQW